MPASLTHHAYKVNQLQQYEADAAQTIGLNLFQLMERAGSAVFNNIRQYYPAAHRMLIVAGKGNNGGDGYIIARLAHQAGLNVTTVVCAERRQIQGDAFTALTLLEEHAVPIHYCLSVKHKTKIINDFKGELIVDCLFGIGFSGVLSKELNQLITVINNKNCTRVSVDVPSGLNADFGTITPIAIKADLTVTLIAYKRGLLSAQAANYVGELILETLSVNSALAELTPTHCFRQNKANLPQLIPRAHTSHKGSIGMMLAAGGDSTFTGAICLASEMALRAGAALVSVCCHEHSRSVLLSRRPELMVVANCGKTLASSTLLEKVKSVVIGPGLGRNVWSKAVFEAAINIESDKVIDADGLYFLANNMYKSNKWILTPHPGEAAQLLGCGIADIELDRFFSVKAIAKKYGGICVLKGAGTLISDGQNTWINTTGNAGMASGGMGDVLSGLIGALILQTESLFQAARLGVYIHGLAADIIAKQQGQIGILASDLYPEVQRLINSECNL